MKFIKRYWPNIAIAACVLLLFIAVASAHQAATGWTYDSSCCSGRDCQMVPVETVKVTREGYLVTIPAGVHKMAPNGFSGLVPYRVKGEANKRVRISGDNQYHVCLAPYNKKLLCIYVPPGGV